MKQKALAREDRLRQILQVFAIDLQQGGTGEFTTAEIARKMQLAPSTKLRLMIEELVMEGGLQSRREAIPGVCQFRRIYSPDPNAFKMPKPQYRGAGRSIKINSKQTSFFAEVAE